MSADRWPPSDQTHSLGESGTLATKRFYLSFFSKTSDGETYLVIRFTNALPFYFMISTLNLFTPVKLS